MQAYSLIFYIISIIFIGFSVLFEQIKAGIQICA